jgi:glycosyltransferase involved in cell wall biosynthesis
VGRLNPIGLIHHPLADETGIDPARAARLEAAEISALALLPQIIVTSPWTRRRLAGFNVDRDRIAVVMPGIDRGPMAAPQASPTLRLLNVATITPRKGHALLVNALAELSHLDWTLRCAGSLELDRSCAEALKLQIVQLGLADRISLLGELPPERIRDEYADADLFVLPSYLEGFGMALAEAIVHGLPVVATTAGAIPDTVPSAAGLLIPPGDVAALTAALNRLMTEQKLRQELQRGAREAAADLPSWNESARRFAAILNLHSQR